MSNIPIPIPTPELPPLIVSGVGVCTPPPAPPKKES